MYDGLLIGVAASSNSRRPMRSVMSMQQIWREIKLERLKTVIMNLTEETLLPASTEQTGPFP